MQHVPLAVCHYEHHQNYLISLNPADTDQAELIKSERICNIKVLLKCWLQLFVCETHVSGLPFYINVAWN